MKFCPSDNVLKEQGNLASMLSLGRERWQSAKTPRAGLLECGDTTPLLNDATCRVEPKRGHFRALQTAGQERWQPAKTSRAGLSIRNPQSAIRNGFTLLELLIVIAIMGILATIGIPAIRGMTKSNSMVAADRQLLDDLSYARRLAIANHTTIYVVFVPPEGTAYQKYQDAYNPAFYPQSMLPLLTNLWGGQYTTYAMFSFRSVGDQPGQQSPHYWTPWRTLPSGIYIATNKFIPGQLESTPGYATNFSVGDMSFPYPAVTNVNQPKVYLPYLAFNYLGQLVSGSGETPVIQQGGTSLHEYIPLAHGSIFYQRDANGGLLPQAPDIVETPRGNAYYTSYASTNAATGVPLPGIESTNVYNQIYIDPLTGKARVQRLEIQ